MPGLSSVIRNHGPVADENELEYISSLHQTCVPSLRKNGTISSADIALLLHSKFGVQIHSETAKDIACNLCGARRTAERKKKAISSLTKVKDKMKRRKRSIPVEVQSAEDIIDDEFEEDDEEVYFDIIQLLSLLIIPNLLEFDENEQNEIFETSIDCLLEPLYDEEEEEIRRTGKINIAMLRKIFIAAGDLDSSQDDELMAQMVKMLDQHGSFGMESFKKCLLSDVQEGFAKDAVLQDTSQTSTFYDVFGCNWEKAGDTFQKFQKVPTFSFVDYASQSYFSTLYNTLMWGLFFFTILYYWIYLGKAEIDHKLKLGCSGFACDIGERTISWIVTGLVVGTFGLMIVLSFGLTNTASKDKKKRTVVSTLAILFISIIPFLILMIYRGGIPHNPIIKTSYQNICPPDFVTDQNSTVPFPLVFDNFCNNMESFCLRHIEFQGKNILKNPQKLTIEESKRCVDGAVAYGLFLPAYQCVNSTCHYDKLPTCYDDSDCEIANHRGSCGYEFDDKDPGEKTCCKSGAMTLTENGPICTRQNPGSPCTTNAVCEGFCDPETGTCVHDDRKLPNGSNCTAHSNCTSLFCNWDYECDLIPEICPTYLKEIEPDIEDNEEAATFYDFLFLILDNARILPVCVTEERFCKENSYPEEECPEIIDVLSLASLVVVNEKNETNMVIEEDPNWSRVEASLNDVIAFISLVLVGIISFLLFGCLVYQFFYKDDERARDFSKKEAAQLKIHTLIKNAFEMHQHEGELESEGHTMRNYFAHSKDTETIGGLMWTVSAIKSGELSKKYGIHIPARIYIANSVQWVSLIALVVGSIILLINGKEELEKFRDSKKPLTQEEVNRMTTDEFYRLSDARLLSAYVPSDFYDAIPLSWMLVASIAPGIIVGTLVSIMNIIIYVPSFVSTVMQLRVGSIPNFHDPRFTVLRSASDKVSLNLGNVFFSMIGCFVLIVVVLGLCITAFVWQFTRTLALRLLAMGIGIGISTVLKMILQGQIRKRYFRTLYRRDSIVGNVSNIFFECWYIATATLTVVVRIGVVVFRLCLAMGRLDISFIHADVGADAPADSFRCEILVAEAHNHPYIDRLSGIYLRRVRDGYHFGSPAGQAWRTLFVMGLCPWMIKFRANIASQNSSINKISTDEESLQKNVEKVE